MDQNLSMTRGDTGSFNLQFINYDGDLENDMQSMIFTVKENVDSGIAVFQKTLGSGISKVNDSLYVVRIAPTDTEDLGLGYYYYDLQIRINGDAFTVLKGVIEITYDVTTTEQTVIIAPYEELEDIRVGYNGRLYDTAGEAVRGQISDLHNEVNVLDGRMDAFTSLEEGSTTGDAELQDIRVGANGVTYPSAGDAVRGQVEELDDKIDNNTDAIGDIDSDVDILKARMDVFTSLEDGSTTGDAELQDIRVGANGYIYPTAGDAVRGQVSDLKNDINVIERLNLFNGNTHSGIHSQTNGASYGTATENANYFYTDLIPLNDAARIFVFSNFIGNYTVYVTFFNSSQIVVGSTYGDNIIASDIPNNAVSFCVCVHIDTIPTLMVMLSVPTEYNSWDVAIVNAVNKASIKHKRIDRGYVTGYMPPQTQVGRALYRLSAASNIFTSYPVSLEDITDVSYNVVTPNYVTVLFVGSDGKITGNQALTPKTKGTLTIPDGSLFFVWYAGNGNNFNPATEICFVEGATPPDIVYGYNDYEFVENFVESDVLKGKTVVFDGDSITEGAGVTDISTGISPNNNKGWGYWIQQKHPTSDCYGYAKSGWTVGRKTGETDSLLNHIPQYPNDVDLFVLSGGYNDQAQQMAMGEIVPVTDGSDSYFNTTFDEYTFCGALEYWFQQLRTNYPFAQIVYIITPQRIYASNPVFNNDTKGVRVKDVLYSNGKDRMDLFWQKIRDVCDKWAIKYLDFSKTSGVVGTGELTDPGLTIGTRYFSTSNGVPDFTHPNTNYYKNLLAPQVDAFIKSVIW